MAFGLSDFPPLLTTIGLHEISMDQLRGITVHKFPLSRRRPAIISGFTQIVCKLVEYRVKGDLIIDGSFLTEEIEPSDIDFVLCVSEAFFENSSVQQREYLEWIRDEKTIKATHHCDCYLCVECSEDSPMHFDGIQDRKYWTTFYTYSKVVKRARGLALIRLNGSLL